MTSLFTVQELNHLIQRDSTPIFTDYENNFHNIIQNYWDEIRTDFHINDQNLSNSIRYRLSNGGPVGQTNHYPKVLGHNHSLINFIRSTFYHYLRYEVFSVNFAFCLAIIDENGDRFLYASSNFQCLPVAHSVNSDFSKQAFLQVLNRFDLQEYVNETIQSLTEKYDNVLVFPISLNLSITRDVNRVYGYNRRGLSNTKSNGNCLFNCLSALYSTKRGKVEKKQHMKPCRYKCSPKEGKKLKAAFLKWVAKKKDKVNPADIFLEGKGICQYGLSLCEEFFQCNFNLFEFQLVERYRVSNNATLVKKGKKHTVIRKQSSFQKFKSNANFLVTSESSNQLMNHLQLISNPALFDQKFVCQKCGKWLSRQSWFNEHIEKGCQNPRRYIQNSVIQFTPSIAKTMEKQLTAKLHTDNNFSSVQCEIINSNNSCVYQLTVDCITNGASVRQIQYSNTSLTKCAEFLIKFFSSISPKLLINRVAKNMDVMAELEQQLERNNENKSAVNYEASLDVSCTLQKLFNIKDYLINYLSHYPVFVLVHSYNQFLASSVLKELMAYILNNNEGSSEEKPHFELKRGQMSFLQSKGISFASAHKHLPFFLKKELSHKNNTEVFIQLLQNIKKDFDVDYSCQPNTTTTQIAKTFFSNFIDSWLKQSFISPPQELEKLIDNSAKYGFLTCKRTLVHPTAENKSYYALDFCKFYGNVLCDFNPYLGSPMRFTLTDDGNFALSKHGVPHYMFANLLFLTLQSVCTGSWQFQLFGKEARIDNLPIDAVVSYNNKEGYTAINYQGCFFHNCRSNNKISACHDPNVMEPSHSLTCSACIESKQPDDTKGFRPSLWKLKPGQNQDSIHPLKRCSFKELNDQTTKVIERISASSYVNECIEITECDVVAHWSKPLWHFLSYLNLPCNKTCNTDVLLKECFLSTVSEHFPLIKPKKPIGKQELVSELNKGSLHGFVQLSASLDPESCSLLKNFPIFSKLDDKAKMENCNSFTNELCTMQFVTYLLNQKKLISGPKNFQIHHIKEFYLYPKTSETPFEKPAKTILQMVASHQGQKCEPYLKFLKNVNNFEIGSFRTSLHPTASTKACLLKKNEFQNLLHHQNFVSSEQISSNYSISKFQSRSSYKHMSNNHLGIIQMARAVFLQFVFTFSHYLNCSIISCNTDGLILASPVKLPPPISKNGEQTSCTDILALDLWLKPDLSYTDIQQYIEFKMKYFINISVCQGHKNEYIQKLITKELFQPQNCCIKNPMVHKEEQKYKIKIENFGDTAAVLGINKSIQFNKQTKAATIKASGIQNINIQRFFRDEPAEVQQLFNELIAVNSL